MKAISSGEKVRVFSTLAVSSDVLVTWFRTGLILLTSGLAVCLTVCLAEFLGLLVDAVFFAAVDGISLAYWFFFIDSENSLWNDQTK
jgi:hypothetical protein